MKKFTKTLESKHLKKWEVLAEVKLEIFAQNEGEAGYIADSVLQSIREQSDYTIKNIDEAK